MHVPVAEEQPGHEETEQNADVDKEHWPELCLVSTMPISTWPLAWVWVLLVQFHQLCPPCVVFLDGGVCFLYQQHHWPIQT